MSVKTAEATVTQGVLGRMEMHDHEEVLFSFDRTTGLRAIIAVHDTTLGPALGGTRMWPYASEEEAKLLGIREGDAVIYRSGVVSDGDGVPTEYFKSVARSEFIRFASVLTR